MHFRLVDRVVERGEGRLVALKLVTSAEEYLQDHFPGFPVLPGVLMLEAMVQAARELVGEPADHRPLVLGEVRALKYGRFVRPGDVLRVEVELVDAGADGAAAFRGEARVGEGERAVSGRFSLRPARPGTATGLGIHG